jgi:hypothetical protein
MSNRQSWPKRSDGTPYPPASERKPNRKTAARLAARVAAWDAVKTTDNNGKKCSQHGGFELHKPGSYKK